MEKIYGESDDNVKDTMEIFRGVFPSMRDDVSVLISNPKYMTDKERSWLRHYKIIDGGVLYEFDAYFVTFVDGSQSLCVAKYEVNGVEITHAKLRLSGY